MWKTDYQLLVLRRVDGCSIFLKKLKTGQRITVDVYCNM